MIERGVYYYIWHEETMRCPGEIIPRELDDILDLKFQFLLVDLEPSLFRKSLFRKALDELIGHCGERGLRIMPICNIGFGMIPEADMTEEMVALNDAGEPVRNEGTWGFQMSYYSPRTYAYIEEHTGSLLEAIRPAQYFHTVRPADGGGEGRRPVLELMEDVGYTRYAKTDFSAAAGEVFYSKEIAVAGFLERLRRFVHEKFGGYRCLLKTFRDANPYHDRIGNMGLDYELLGAVSDGTIETVAPVRREGAEAYGPVERGLELQCRMTPPGKIRFGTILCERPWFDPMEHARVIAGLDRFDAVVWYNYNEVITSPCDLKGSGEMRAKRMEVWKEFGF